MVRILKNKTASDVTVQYENTGAVVPANGQADLALVFQSWQLANIDSLVLLLAQGTDYFQLNDGTDDLGSVAAIDLIRGYSQNINIKTSAITLPSQEKGFQDLTGHNFYKKGLLTLATAGETTDIYLKFSSNMYLCGGGYRIGITAAVGDQLLMQIVDKDNALGYGAGFVVATFLDTDYCWPEKEWSVLTGDAKLVPSVLYLRMRYISTGYEDVDIIGWYYMRT
jgi:hypothetical protein